MKTFINIFNELNEADTKACEIKKQVFIESDKVTVKNKVEEAAPVSTNQQIIDAKKDSADKGLYTEERKDKEERLASLKTQLEKDKDQLAADEIEAIEKEIADLEAELFEKEKLNETGEWDDNDDEMKIWKEELRDKAEYIANEIHGSVASVSGFDKYQGPVAIISTPIHGDVQLWFDNEDDTGLSLLCKIAHVGWIQGSANDISDILSKEVIPEDKIINESEEVKGKEVLNELGTDSTIDKLIAGDELYFRNNDGLALMVRYADTYDQPEDYDEGYTQGWERGADEEFDKVQDENFAKAKQAAEEGNVWEVLEIDETTLQPNGSVYGYLYGQEELAKFLKEVREVRVVKRLEESKKICEKCGKEVCECDKSINESGEDIKKDLNIEAGSDEEAELDNILDTNYNDLFDNLDDEEKEEYNKIAATIRDLKPEEALIDVIDEIESKAKENGLEKDLLIFAYLNKGKMNEAAPINSDLKKGKEDRLASLKTQLEADEDQLSDDEKKAIEDEIAQLEKEVYTESSIKTKSIEKEHTKIEEAEVSNLKTIKSQGNIFMLEDDNQYIVGENYNEPENIIENAEIYSTKEEADKDYFNRCGITLEESAEQNLNNKSTNLYDRCYHINDREELKEIALNAIYVANNDQKIIDELNDRLVDLEKEECHDYLVKFSEAPYDFVANNYTNIPLELLREIALNAVYVANNDEAIEKEIKDRIVEYDETYKTSEKDLSKDLFGSEAEKRQSEADRALEKYLDLAREIKAGNNDTITLDSAKQLLKKAYIKAKGYYSFEPEEIDRRIAKDIPDLFGDLEEGVISDLKATHLAKKAAKLSKEKDFNKSTKAFAKSMEINDKSANKLDNKAKKLENKADKLRNEAIVKRNKSVKDFTSKK